MSASERRAEIMRILVGRRKCYLSDLAQELGVSKRTIQRDVQTLVLQYPLESIHGNGGGIRLADWYHPHRNILSQEQIRTLRANTAPKIRFEALRIAFSSRNPISTTLQTSDNSYFTRDAYQRINLHRLQIL